MTRFFLTIEDAKEVYLDEITLLNSRLFIADEKISESSIRPIISTKGYDKSEVDEFNNTLRARGRQLLFEVYPNEINNKIMPENLLVLQEEKKEDKKITRYFLTYEDGMNFYQEGIDLLDKRLVIKDSKKGNIELHPIINLNGMYKNEVEKFRNKLIDSGKELLVEVYEDDLSNINLPKKLIKIREQNKIYKEVKNQVFKDQIELIEYGYLKDEKTINPDEFQMVKLTPVNNADDFLYLHEVSEDEEMEIDLLRKDLNYQKVGADVYLYTQNERLFDEAKAWITVIKPVLQTSLKERQKYVICEKNHLLLKPLKKEQGSSMNYQAFDDYQTLIQAGTFAKKQRLTDDIVLSNTEYNDYDDYLIIRKENLHYLMDKYQGEIPFESNLEVYKESAQKFTKMALRDSLGIKQNLTNKKEYFVINRGYNLDHDNLNIYPVRYFEVEGWNNSAPLWREITPEESALKQSISLIDITNHPEIMYIYEKYNSLGHAKTLVRKYNPKTDEVIYDSLNEEKVKEFIKTT